MSAAAPEFPELAPVMDPLFNLEQVCDEMVLLQDHLGIPSFRCPDCICKHFIKIRALLREAKTLDTEGRFNEYSASLAQIVDSLFSQWRYYVTAPHSELSDAQVELAYHNSAQAVRKLRKQLQTVCYPLTMRT